MKRNKNFSDDLMEIIPSGESMSVMEWLADDTPMNLQVIAGLLKRTKMRICQNPWNRMHCLIRLGS